MKIDRNRLVHDDGTAVPFVKTPNMSGKLKARFLVMHYTAGRDAEGAIRTLCNPGAKASAHLVIGRDGAITQLVPFDRIAWHAGASSWLGLEGLNRHSIGIELANAGRLRRVGNRWESWFRAYYDDSEVTVARHKNDPPGAPESGWHAYTGPQIDAALAASEALVAAYGLEDVIGHEDIAPGRKSDPGPDFPMESFRSRLFGRAEDAPPEFVTTTTLNVRSGPGTDHAPLPGSPLPSGTHVTVVGRQGIWWNVDVLDTVNDVNDLVGWVHSRYLKPA